MSMFDNKEMDDLYREVVDFLRNHKTADLVRIVMVAIEDNITDCSSAFPLHANLSSAFPLHANLFEIGKKVR